MQLKRISTSGRWFIAAVMLLILFGVYTAIFSMGVLLYPTLYVEQQLLHRPLTRIDCVLVEWKNLGDVGFSLFFTLVLGVVCLLLKYRVRVVLFLFLLLLLGVEVEYVGKQYFPQVIPINTQFGMNSLACPQIWSQPRSARIMVALGMWWKAPPVHPGRIRNEQYSANAPLIFDDNATVVFGYPSGHSLRWCFLGLVACWLIWRYIRIRILRTLLMTFALAIAFGGGFAQFYIGLHLATDLVGGYLLGASSACCAIGVLLRNERKSNKRILHVHQTHAQDTLDIGSQSA